MGRPKFPRRKYAKPLHPWKEERIKTEKELIRKYGLKNHKEVWKAKTLLRKYRAQARELLGKIGGTNPQVKKESEQLLLRLTRINVLPENSTLDDVLALDVENILSRRLQTIVYHRGLATTIKHARQLITHGHISIGGRKVTIPGYIVTKDEENIITYNPNSALNLISHPARPKTEVQKVVVASTRTGGVETIKTEKPVDAAKDKEEKQAIEVVEEKTEAIIPDESKKTEIEESKPLDKAIEKTQQTGEQPKKQVKDKKKHGKLNKKEDDKKGE